MFTEMRAALQIPKTVDIITHIRSLPNIADQREDSDSGSLEPSAPPFMSSPQSRARAIIESIERRTMTTQTPQPGLNELMSYLTARSVPKALCTRNFPAPVLHLLERYLPDEEFDPIITRDTVGVRPKPSPEGLWECAQVWLEREGSNGRDSALDGAVERDGAKFGGEDLEGDSSDPITLARTTLGPGMIMVGDSFDDMVAGYRAGAATLLLVNEENEALLHHEYTDLGIRRLDELIGILEEGFVGGDWDVTGMEGSRKVEEYEVEKR